MKKDGKIGKPFKKGQSGNPSGRPKIPQDIQDAINAGREALARDLCEIENMTLAQAKKIDIENIPVRKGVILKAFIDRDQQAIKTYQDRVYGKAVETVNLKETSSFVKKFLNCLTEEDLDFFENE